VSTGGNDSGSCTSAAPCRSFARAYAVAQAGEVVEVAAGTYPNQFIGNQPSRTGADVVFRPAPGARVILDGLDIGDSDPSTAASRVTVSGMEMTYKSAEPGQGNQSAVWVNPGSSYVTLENIDAGSVTTWLTDHVTIKGGDYGPCHATWPQSANVCGNSKLDASTNTVIDGATFHDYRFDQSCFTVSGADCHWECMYVNGGHNTTIKNSKFRACALFNIFATISGPDAGRLGHKNLLIENNWFATPYTEELNAGSPARGTGVWLAHCDNSAQGFQDVTIRFNAFQANTTLGADRPAGCVWSNIKVTANLMMQTSCQSGWTYAYNAYSTQGAGGTCSATDTILGANLPYADGGGTTTMDYHLAATTTADNRVPATAGCPTTDIDGQARPTTGNCDAGSDER
jgi:hypothetical protein